MFHGSLVFLFTRSTSLPSFPIPIEVAQPEWDLPGPHAGHGETHSPQAIPERKLSLTDLGLGKHPALESETSSALDGESALDPDSFSGESLSAENFARLSYIDRINQHIGHRWRKDIDERLTLFYGVGQSLPTSESVTRLLVKRGRDGAVQTIALTESSGVTTLDEAAVNAFKSASPIPNPPQELLRKREVLPIRWAFIVHRSDSPKTAKF